MCLQVVDAIANVMESRPRPSSRRGGVGHQAGQKISWADVRVWLEAMFQVPFDDLCVRLPPGDGMGIFISSE